MKSILTSLFSLVLCASLQAQLPSYVPADGLVGWWPFNGNANDESGNAYNGLISPGTNGSISFVEDRNSLPAGAVKFSSNNTWNALGPYITLTNSQGLLATPTYTINYFLNVGSNNVTGEVINTGADNAVGSFINRVNQGTMQAFIGGYADGVTVNIEANTWLMITITRELSGTIRLMHDVNVVASFDNSGFVSSSSPIHIGAMVSGGTNGSYYPFQGSIDDIAIYNRALTPAEITQLYTAAEEPVATCAPLAPNLQNGLVGYWPFCGNANDESGNGNHGVVNGATLAEDRFGNAASSYVFDGHDDKITVNNPNLPVTAMSVSCWFNTANSSGWQYLVTKRYSNSSYPWNSISLGEYSPDNSVLLPNTPETMVCGIYTSNFQNQEPVFEGLFNSGEWYHIGFTWDGEFIRYFVNGAAQGQTAINGTMQYSSLPLFFGSSGLVDQTLFGSLDDIAIWNRALTPEEIAQLYTGAAAPCNLIASETQDTPVEVGGSAQLYVTLNASDYSMQWQTNAAGLGWMDVQDNNTYTGSQTQNLLVSNASLANHEQPFRIIVTDGICNDTSDVALLLVNNTCTAYDTITTIVEVFDTLTIENLVEVYDTLTTYNTIDIFDTTTVTVEVFDTITNVIDVLDTTTIYLQVDIFDTLFIDVYDTTYVQQTIDVYDTTYVTLTDTTYIQVIDTAYVTVTDTLLIDITFVGFEGQPSWLNTVLVYPNPTSDHITIDYGNFALMAGYNTVITDAAGATVYSSAVNTQQATIDINAWGAAGVYYMSIYDVNGAVVAVRQIVLE